MSYSYDVSVTYQKGKVVKVEVEGITLPLGVKVVDFRVPSLWDLWLDRTGQVRTGEMWPESKDTVPIVIDEVRQMYGKPFAELTPPEGYVFTGEFRTPNEVENYWDPLQYVGLFYRANLFTEPRLILAEAPKSERIVFEVVGRDRQAEPGEWMTDNRDNLILSHPVWMLEPSLSTWKYLLRRVE